jgi:RNA recognition motif-containing protein
MSQEKPSQGIFVSGLPIYSCKNKLKTLFSQFGQVKFVRIFSKKQGRKNQSFAKIKFEDPKSVEIALQMSGRLQYEDRTVDITVLKSQSKLEKSLHNNKSIVMVENLPDKPKKQEILQWMVYNGIPAKKIIRIIKKKVVSQNVYEAPYFTYGCIL